jgi:hypothetical protein
MYFGGLGAGKGWDKYYFILPSESFERIFKSENCIFVKDVNLDDNNERCLVDNVINYYKIYLNNCIYEKKDSKLINHFQFYITSTMEIFVANEIMVHKRPKKVFSANEPLIGLQSSSLELFNGKLYTDILEKNSISVGLCLSYPKIYSIKSENYSIMHKSDESANAKLYFNLKQQINLITIPCRIKTHFGIRKTRFRIYPGMINTLNASPNFINLQLQIITS